MISVLSVGTHTELGMKSTGEQGCTGSQRLATSLSKNPRLEGAQAQAPAARRPSCPGPGWRPGGPGRTSAQPRRPQANRPLWLQFPRKLESSFGMNKRKEDYTFLKTWI